MAKTITWKKIKNNDLEAKTEFGTYTIAKVAGSAYVTMPNGDVIKTKTIIEAKEIALVSWLNGGN